MPNTLEDLICKHGAPNCLFSDQQGPPASCMQFLPICRNPWGKIKKSHYTIMYSLPKCCSFCWHSDRHVDGSSAVLVRSTVLVDYWQPNLICGLGAFSRIYKLTWFGFRSWSMKNIKNQLMQEKGSAQIVCVWQGAGQLETNVGRGRDPLCPPPTD